MEFGNEKYGFLAARAFEHIEAQLIQNEWLNKKLRILAFAGNHDGKWFNAFTIIRPIEKITESRPKPISKHYSILRAQIQDVSLEELKALVELHKETGTFVIDGLEIHGKVNLDGWSLTKLAGGNFYDSRSCLVCRGTPNPQYGLPHGSLLDYENTYFAKPIEFVNEYTNLRLSEHDDPVKSIVIVIPDNRAYFSNIVQAENQLVVDVGGIAATKEKFKIKGEVWVQGVAHKVDAAVINGKADITIATPVSAIQLWLIDAANNVYDEYYEPRRWHDSRVQHRIFNVVSSTPDSGLQQLIAMALKTGENEEFEFKTYIKIANQKIDELVQTILAFLNTHGGAILMGITDGMDVEGIDKEAFINATNKESLAMACDEYVAELKQLVNREIVGPHAIKYDVVEYLGRRLLIISVPRGQARPHMRLGKKDCVYVRRGANNAQANREEILQMAGPGGFGGSLSDMANQVM